jgi:hypothetical protein
MVTLKLELDLTDYDFKAMYSQAGIRGFETIEGYILELFENNKAKYYNFSRVDVKKSLVTYLSERNLESSLNIMHDFKSLLDGLDRTRLEIAYTIEELETAKDKGEVGGLDIQELEQSLIEQKQELKRSLEILEGVKTNFDAYMDGIEYDWSKEISNFKYWYDINVA